MNPNLDRPLHRRSASAGFAAANEVILASETDLAVASSRRDSIVLLGDASRRRRTFKPEQPGANFCCTCNRGSSADTNSRFYPVRPSKSRVCVIRAPSEPSTKR